MTGKLHCYQVTHLDVLDGQPRYSPRVTIVRAKSRRNAEKRISHPENAIIRLCPRK